MRILLINHYAGSPYHGMEFRPYYLSREWRKSGHDVTILGASFSHLRMKQPTVKKIYTIEYIDGIRYIWIKTPVYKSSSLLRILNISTFVFSLLIHARKIAEKFSPDIVINSSTYPLDVYPARKISRIAGARLIYEIHDLWPLSPMLIGGYSEKHPFIRVMQKAEDTCYRCSDKVVSLLWNAIEHIHERKYYDVDFVCIPNGYCRAEWNSNCKDLPELHVKLFSRLKENGKIIIGYSGGHTPSTALQTLIGAAELLKSQEKIVFVLVGNGVSKNELQASVQKKNLENVFFLDSVPKIMIPRLIANFDIAYMGGTHSILHKYGTSFNKMTDYMLSSKPIIFAADEPGSLIERIGCGIRVEAENSELVAETVEKLIDKSVTDLKEMGYKGYEYAVNNLEYHFLAQKFLNNI